MPWIGPMDRINYFFNINKPYEKNNNISNTELWINANLNIIPIVIILNIYCLWKINNKTSCTVNYKKFNLKNVYRNFISKK